MLHSVINVLPGDTLLCIPKTVYEKKIYKLHLCAVKELVISVSMSVYFYEKILLTEKKYIILDDSTWAQDVNKK